MASQNTSERAEVVFLSPTSNVSQLMEAVTAGGRPVTLKRSWEELLDRMSKDPAPAVVILDVGAGEMLQDPRLVAMRPRLASVPVIAVSDPLGPDLVRQLLKLQANDWLQRPFSSAEFMTALSHTISTPGLASAVSLFIPASGGAGATSLALIAASRSQKLTGSVCLVDLDFQHANCGVYLNVESAFDLGALVNNPERLDAELLEQIKSDHTAGFTIFSFERPDLYFAPSGKEFVLRLLDLVSTRYKSVIIDLPYIETPWFADVVRASDRATVVFEANVPSMRHARRAAVRLRELGSVDIRAIANKTAFRAFGNAISKKDVERLLVDIPVSYVREDGQTMSDTLNRGLLPSEVAGRSKFVREAEEAGTPAGSK